MKSETEGEKWSKVAISEKIAKKLGVTVDLLKEGENIARRYELERKKNKEFQLRTEDFCKRIWKPFFQKRWHLIDLTQPATANFQVDPFVDGLAISNDAKNEVKIWLKQFLLSIHFPCDGIMYRSISMVPFDYKFRMNTSYGIGIEVEDYNRYYKEYVKEKKLPFWILIWDQWRLQRKWHRVRDPSQYHKTLFRKKWYYVVEKDCFEVPLLPYRLPSKPMAALYEIALELKMQSPDWNGNSTLNDEDIKKAEKFIREKSLEELKESAVCKMTAKDLNIGLDKMLRALKKSQSKQA